MDVFDIPHDIKILQEVFQTAEKGQGEGGRLYNRENKFWKCWSCQELVDESEEGERARLEERLREVKRWYGGLSETYQQSKASQTGQIPLN